MQERSAQARLARAAKHQSSSLPPGRPHWLRTANQLPEGLDVVVKAVPEQVPVKQAVLAVAYLRRPRLLGTNTSAIPIASLVVGLPDPSALIGLHFFDPVWAMALLEVVRSTHSCRAAVDGALALARQLDKESVVVADTPGFATSRLGVALGLEAMRMLQEGVASAEDLDRVMELGYRHPMGPLRLSNVVGLGVRLDIARTLAAAYGDRFAPPQILLDKVAAGELGRKSGQGFYAWPLGRATTSRVAGWVSMLGGPPSSSGRWPLTSSW
jgi:3-hydroxybutyryl-CoA dehydrogenase